MKTEFSGAEYLASKHLRRADGTRNRHWSGLVSRDSGLVYDPATRDIGQAFGFLMKESLHATAELAFPDEEADAAGRDALDLIGKFMAGMWNTSLEDNLNGLCQFQVLYDEIARTPEGKAAYNLWTHFFVQTFFCYMHTITKMTNGLCKSFQEPAASEMNSALLIMGSLDPELRRQVIRQLADRGMWPSNVSYAPLLRRLEDYLKVCREEQEMIRKEEAGRDNGEQEQ